MWQLTSHESGNILHVIFSEYRKKLEEHFSCLPNDNGMVALLKCYIYGSKMLMSKPNEQGVLTLLKYIFLLRFLWAFLQLVPIKAYRKSFYKNKRKHSAVCKIPSLSPILMSNWKNVLSYSVFLHFTLFSIYFQTLDAKRKLVRVRKYYVQV